MQGRCGCDPGCACPARLAARCAPASGSCMPTAPAGSLRKALKRKAFRPSAKWPFQTTYVRLLFWGWGPTTLHNGHHCTGAGQPSMGAWSQPPHEPAAAAPATTSATLSATLSALPPSAELM